MGKTMVLTQNSFGRGFRKSMIILIPLPDFYSWEKGRDIGIDALCSL